MFGHHQLLCNRKLTFILSALTLTAILPSPSQAVEGLVKPDYCYTIGAGTADVEVVFFPSKLTITQPELGGDNADYYQIVRSDGQVFDIDVTDHKNIHDTESEGQIHSYGAVSRNDRGQSSHSQACVNYEAVSSISPGRLRDWQRDAEVVHAADKPADATGSRHFSGLDHDVVSTAISDEESESLNPAGDLFAFQAKVTLDENEIDALKQNDNPSWNVMQRGYAHSNEGQWKMSLVTTTNEDESKTVHAQCIARDGHGGVIRANSTYALTADRKTTITCLIDDISNTVRVIVNGRTDSPTRPKTEFGNVDPHHDRSTCWRQVADTISIGNKPKCSAVGPDDRFQGTIHLARVLKGVSDI